MRNHWNDNDTFSFRILAHPQDGMGDLWLYFMPMNPWWSNSLPSSDRQFRRTVSYMIGK